MTSRTAAAGARPIRRIGRRLMDFVLLPLALVVVVLEDIVWRGLRRLLRMVEHLRPIVHLSRRLARLSGWTAVPLFLVPETLGRVGEFWAFKLFVHGHLIGGASVYVAVRLLATLMAVFIYHACEPALMRVAVFARAVAWAGQVRDWALGLIAPWRAWLRGMVKAGPSFAVRRFATLRRRLARRV